MSSESLAYEGPLRAYAEGQPAYGEALPEIEATDDAAEHFDRGKDWPLAFAIFTPVLAAYGAIVYGLYLAGADAIF